ncbi:hypothetical protein ACFL6X_02510 [Candidatus Latescibacterota bacterium]
MSIPHLPCFTYPTNTVFERHGIPDGVLADALTGLQAEVPIQTGITPSGTSPVTISSVAPDILAIWLRSSW